MTKRELLKDLGITDRLLKFWVGWYKLTVNRRGRGSTYPAQTVETLRLVKRLSESKYFTMRFIRDLIRSTQGGDRGAIDSYMALCRSILHPAKPELPQSSPSVSEFRPLWSAPPTQKRMGTDLL